MCRSQTRIFPVSQFICAVILNLLEYSLAIPKLNSSHCKTFHMHRQTQHVKIYNFHQPAGELRPVGQSLPSQALGGTLVMAEVPKGLQRSWLLRALACHLCSASIPRLAHETLLSPNWGYSTTRTRLYDSGRQY